MNTALHPELSQGRRRAVPPEARLSPKAVAGARTALEQRRLNAAYLLLSGARPSAVARTVHASLQGVYKWRRVAKGSGIEALRASNRAGRPPKVDRNGVLARIQALELEDRLWTLEEFREFLICEFSVAYHPAHAFRIMGLLNLARRQRNPAGKVLMQVESDRGR